MTILSALADEPAEPMTKDEFARMRKQIRANWNGSIVIEKRDVEQLIAEIIWLKRRLQRVEHAIEPLVSALTTQ